MCLFVFIRKIEIIQVIVSVKPFGTFMSSSNSIITLYTLVFCGVFLHTYSCSWKFLVNGMALTNTEDLAFYNWQLANRRFLLNVAMHLYSIPYLLFVLILKIYFHICWWIYILDTFLCEFLSFFKPENFVLCTVYFIDEVVQYSRLSNNVASHYLSWSSLVIITFHTYHMCFCL